MVERFAKSVSPLQRVSKYTSKHGKGKSLWKKLFCCTYQYIGEFDRANKKKSVIYTLTVGFQSNYQQIKANFQLEAVNS